MVSSQQVDSASGPAGVETAVQGNTRFALDLYRTQQATPGNLVFSPYSISVAPAMTYAGARGKTAAQMAGSLHFDLDQQQLHAAFAALEAGLGEVGQQGAVQLSVANGLWPQQGCVFLEEHLALAERFYGAPVTPLDYRNPEAASRGAALEVEGIDVLDGAPRLDIKSCVPDFDLRADARAAWYDGRPEDGRLVRAVVDIPDWE